MNRPRANPYRRPPVEVVGRTQLLEDLEQDLLLIGRTGRGGPALAIAGDDGMGRTTAVNAATDQAATRSWVCLQLRGAHPLGPALAGAAHTALREELRSQREPRPALLRALATFRGFQATTDPEGRYPLAVDPGTGPPDATPADVLRDLGALARDRGAGVMLAVDDLHDSCSSDQSMIDDLARQLSDPDSVPAPVQLIAVGDLETMGQRPGTLYQRRTLMPLTPDETAHVLRGSAQSEHVVWTAGAVDDVVRHTGGHPLQLQILARHSWDNRRLPDLIDVADVARSWPAAQDEADHLIHQGRWNRATPAERRLLTAMAAGTDGTTSVPDLAARLGLPLTSLSAHRAALIKKRIIWAPRRGHLTFSAPGAADFIRRTTNT